MCVSLESATHRLRCPTSNCDRKLYAYLLCLGRRQAIMQGSGAAPPLASAPVSHRETLALDNIMPRGEDIHQKVAYTLPVWGEGRVSPVAM